MTGPCKAEYVRGKQKSAPGAVCQACTSNPPPPSLSVPCCANAMSAGGGGENLLAPLCVCIASPLPRKTASLRPCLSSPPYPVFAQKWGQEEEECCSSSSNCTERTSQGSTCRKSELPVNISFFLFPLSSSRTFFRTTTPYFTKLPLHFLFHFFLCKNGELVASSNGKGRKAGRKTCHRRQVKSSSLKIEIL